jgi:hypothetical protein
MNTSRLHARVSGKLILAAMYLQRVGIDGRSYRSCAAAQTHALTVVTVVTPPAPGLAKFRPFYDKFLKKMAVFCDLLPLKNTRAFYPISL